MRVRLTTEPDDRICLESPFDAGLVAQLKGDIPYGGREWDGARKRWLISLLYVNDLLRILQSVHAEIQDDREGMRPDVMHIPPMPTDLREAFDALFLAYTAPLCVADASYKALAKYWHPDRGGASADFQRVNDAIQVIRAYLDPKPQEHSNNDDGLPF